MAFQLSHSLGEAFLWSAACFFLGAYFASGNLGYLIFVALAAVLYLVGIAKLAGLLFRGATAPFRGGGGRGG